MKMQINKSFLKGEIDAVPSKSFLHRLLIASALAEGQTRIDGYINSQDADATVDCLKKIGAEISVNNSCAAVKQIKAKENAVVNCGESGSTLRFLIPVICALGLNCEVDGKEGLRKRPLKPLLDTLRKGGATIDGDSLPLKVSGNLKAGKYEIDGGISSQFVSGLLFALPLLKGNSEICIKGTLVSKDYVEITLEVLSQFGIKIQQNEDGFFVEGGQKFVSPKAATVEGDWSNAAFFLAAGAINGDVTVKNLNLNSKQGDRKIAEILNKMGAKPEALDGRIAAKKSELKAIEIDAQDTPDLVPVLSVLCSYAKGRSKITGVERLKLKESDRLEAIVTMLKGMGIEAQTDGSTLIIEGGTPHGGEFSGFNDHRMVMSEAVAAISSEKPTVINGTEAVKKSYPDFFGEFKKLGGFCSEC